MNKKIIFIGTAAIGLSNCAVVNQPLPSSAPIVHRSVPRIDLMPNHPGVRMSPTSNK